jgi:hypothetical protein
MMEASDLSYGAGCRDTVRESRQAGDQWKVELDDV